MPDTDPPASPERERRRGALLVEIVGTIGALVLGGCGGGDPERKAPAAPAFVELEDRLGFDTGGILARQNRVEAIIADCMAENGFEYVPIDPFAQQTLASRASRLSDEDFVRQFGYGISTLWDRGGRAPAGPNERLRAALGAADRRAYDRALGGDHPGVTFSEAVDSGDLTQLGGCTRKAARTAFGDGQVIGQIVAKFDAHDDRVTADPRMVRADERWAACMVSGGYRVESAEDLEDDLTRRMEQIVGPLPGPLATGPPPGEPARPYNRAALAALQREEVPAARRDYACEQKHIAPVEAIVRREYEALFRARNKDLITSVKAAWK